MKRIVYSLLVIAFLFSSCESFKRKVQEADDTKRELNEDYHEEIETPAGSSALEDDPVNPKIVRPDIVDNKGSIDIYKGRLQTIDLEILSMGYDKITARITTEDSEANLRFSEIIMPDGSTDGPFGREITYNLNRDGLYKLMISEDQMAGDYWSGYFTVDFELLFDDPDALD